MTTPQRDEVTKETLEHWKNWLLKLNGLQPFFWIWPSYQSGHEAAAIVASIADYLGTLTRTPAPAEPWDGDNTASIRAAVQKVVDNAESLDSIGLAILCATTVRAADRIDQLTAEAAQLRNQLPPSMQNCTIVFKECEKGHGWLTATNWVQHGCLTCELAASHEQEQRLRGLVVKAASFVVTCRLRNTDEWMRLLVKQVNEMAAAIDDSSRAEFDGDTLRFTDATRVALTPPQGT